MDEGANGEAVLKRAEGGFRKEWQLEEKHVPTAAKLAEICFEIANHDAGVGDIDDGEFGDALRVEEGGAPGNGGAPVMAGEEEFFCVELIGDGDDVRNQMGHRVVGGAARFVAEVVAALVGDDYPKTGVGEKSDLFVPGIPEFGEAVEEDDQGVVGPTGGYGVELDRAVLEHKGFQGGVHAQSLLRNPDMGARPLSMRQRHNPLGAGRGFEAVGGDVGGGGGDFGDPRFRITARNGGMGF